MMKKLALVAALSLSTFGFGETPAASTNSTQPTGTVSGTVTAPSEARITGALELRPTWTSKSGEFHTENTAELGYKFNKNVEAGYTQYFDTNLYNPKEGTRGLGLFAQDGFARLNLSNLWQDKTNGLSFGYEPRAYLPTNARKRDAGMLTVVRNYLKLTKTFSPVVSMTLMEIPMFHVYSRRGTVTSDGPTANPVFENRVYLITDFNITSKLAFSMPVFLESTRFANYQAGAARNDSWGHTIYIWPELTYALDEKVTVGLSYVSGDLIKSDFSQTTIGAGLESGLTQAIARVSL